MTAEYSDHIPKLYDKIHEIMNGFECSPWVRTRILYCCDIFSEIFLNKYKSQITNDNIKEICDKYLNEEFVQSILFPLHVPCVPLVGSDILDPYTFMKNIITKCEICNFYES